MKYIFSWADYASMIIMLILTIIIGVYYGFLKKQNSRTDYLLGGKQMNVWPISFSLISSTISGIFLLTFPTEIYRYGIHQALVTPVIFLVPLLTYFVYLPVFYKLQITSTYEYFNLRFNNKVRIFASIMYSIFMIIYLPIVIYVPGLTISQVTGLNLHYITPIICGICIFYTTVGGLKAVVWTDAFQFIIMIGSAIAILVLGVYSTEGFENIWRISKEGSRLDIDFSLDLTKRDTFWTGTVSTLFTWTSLISVNQSVIQKCMALPSYKEIKYAMVIFAIGLVILMFSSFIIGLAIYAKYHDCDPLASGEIVNYDQVVPSFVLKVGGVVPGLPGIYISGLLSAGLSTLSASLNCLAATIYQDFISPFISKNTSEIRISLILKAIVLIFGIISTLLVYAIEHMGSIFPLATNFISLTGGPLLGLFTIGVLLPIVNAKGALIGGISGIIIMAWITFKSQWYQITKTLSFPQLSISVTGCNVTVDNTLLTHHNPNYAEVEEIFYLYKISTFHYTFISTTIVIVISLIVSFFTKTDKRANKDYICPLVHFLMSNEDEIADKFSMDQTSSLLGSGLN